MTANAESGSRRPMARIDIRMTDHFVFKTEISVRITDINYGLHVGNDAFISLIHEARVRFLNHFGYSEADIEGKSMIISDLAVIYKSQAFYGDRLQFEIGVGEFNTYGCDIFYRVTHSQTHALVVLAKTGIVFFDFTANKVAVAPEVFSSRFSDNTGPDR